MGISGALTTAVTGMRAQAYALENVSGNIANSQTTAFKRIDTAFQDMIPDMNSNRQLAGSVVASSRNTNTVQGDIQTASIGTFMAINGDGYFVVERPQGYDSSNSPVFSGNQLFTRRGDFQPDKDGYLVNGAGYYLKGIPIDPTTGLLTASTPQMLRFTNSFLPAQPTTEIIYRANLAGGADVFDTTKLISNPLYGAPVGARITGTGANIKADASATVQGTANMAALSSAGGTLVINGTSITIGAGDGLIDVKAAINTATTTTGVTATDDGQGHIILTGPDSVTSMVIGSGSSAALLTEFGLSPGTIDPTNLITQGIVNSGQSLTIAIGSNPPQTINFGGSNVVTMADLQTELAGLANCTASVDAAGNIKIMATTASDTITVGGTATAANFGMHVTSARGATGGVIADDQAAFLEETLDGGVIAAHDVAGSAVNVQFRWAKVDSVANGGTDTWNLFYKTDSSATGNEIAWKNAGVNYTFGPNRQMNPPIASTVLTGVTIDGIVLGDITINHGSTGITQFDDANGVIDLNQLQENSVSAGELQSISVSDKGRIVGNYSNGRTLDLADIPLANFSGPDRLKRLDGGAFMPTDESGAPVFGNAGNIVASSLEGSNTDIADEFTKLIVTQQAYSANTRVITTTNQMVQDLLNMLR